MSAEALQSILPIGPSSTCMVVFAFKPSLEMSWSRRERAVDARPSSTLGHSLGIMLSVIGWGTTCSRATSPSIALATSRAQRTASIPWTEKSNPTAIRAPV